MRPLRFVAVLLAFTLAGPVTANEDKDGFVPLFNGRDLSGWVNVNCPPGTFFVRDGEIITTGKPTGFLRTEKQYENFILEMEWMHVNKTQPGNSGLFIWGDPLPAVGTPFTRGIEVQVLVNLEKEGSYTSHGDVFSIQGATCKPDRPHPQGWSRCLPSERRAKGGGEWNHYKVIAKDGTIKLHVNGKEVSGVSECKPRKGYLALESEGAECHFRNLKIRELTTSKPPPEEVAEQAQGFKNLYTGLDLSGWSPRNVDAKQHWQPRDWVLRYDGKGDAKANALYTEKEYGEAIFVVDFRFPPKKEGMPQPCEFVLRDGPDAGLMLTVHPEGKVGLTRHTGLAGEGLSLETKALKPVGQWNRLQSIWKVNRLIVNINGKMVLSENAAGMPARGAFGIRPQGEMEVGNLFVRELGK